ncbi:hypothetical protein B0H16DRAFT_1730770 [Mycena metata]|uniref:Uncharacterized protein n=1 Tax=Mycena metata TaxID=1033252 RepID=A0AAD7I864_9AGAR|nr:hypothetical protein B0H16DRAFT_1730770 [Mycena metata]
MNKPGRRSNTPATENRSRRAAPDSAKIFLDRGRKELFALSTSSNAWGEWTSEEVRGHLVAKGFVKEGVSTLSFNLLGMVVLRIAASLPANNAVAADALRAVAVALELKRVESVVEEVAENVKTLLGLAAKERATEGEEGELTDTLRAAAVHLTRTVEEQANDIASLTTRLDDELNGLSSRAAHAAAAPGPAATVASGPNAAGKQSYAAAASQAHPPARAAALANAAARERQILVEREPGMEKWAEGLTEKDLVEKARMAVVLMCRTGELTPPGDARFVGATLQRSGSLLLHMNSPEAANWIKGNIQFETG